MAKSKTKSKPRKRKKPMATSTRKKRRKKSSSTHRHLSAHHKMKTAPKRRKKRSGLHDSITTNNFVKHGMNNIAGAIGGGAFLATRAVKMHMGLRIGLGVGLAMAASFLKAPNVGAGISGALAYAVGDELAGHKLNELNDDMGDMEDCDYVHPDTLSDTGHTDQHGNPLVIDEDEGIIYALHDNNELHAMADAFALHDGNPFALHDGIQSSSGLPLY